MRLNYDDVVNNDQKDMNRQNYLFILVKFNFDLHRDNSKVNSSNQMHDPACGFVYLKQTCQSQGRKRIVYLQNSADLQKSLESTYLNGFRQHC